MTSGSDLTILGNTTDFIDDDTNTGPDWEHLRLLREPGIGKLTIDTLATPSRIPLPGRRYLDAGQVLRLAARLHLSRAVLAQSEGSGYLAMLAQMTALRTRPLFIIFHGHRWWTKRNRALAGLARRLSWVRFLCLSDALSAIVTTQYGIDPARVHTTGYGVDADYFTPRGEPVATRVVSAGTASRDYQTLVEASRGLAIDLHIAADSTWYAEKLNVSADGLPGNVHIASSGSYGHLRDLYGTAQFVVVPLLDVTYACGYAVIAEAMAMGKAVVATQTGCPSDLIADGISGFYVPPGDVAGLQAVMRRLLSDPALAHRMGEEGRRLVEVRFNLGAYVSRLQASIASRTHSSA